MNRFFLFTIVLVLMFGCRRGPLLPEGLPELIPYKIKLTQEDTPLAGATVYLHNLNDDRRWYPGGVTDSNGVVELYTNGKYKGTPVGKYKIIIAKYDRDKSKVPPGPDEGEPGYAEWLKMASAMNEYLYSYSLVEMKYTEESTTPLEIDITKGEIQEKSFDIGKKVRIRIKE